MDVREKLVELIRDGRYKAEAICNENNDCQTCTISDPVGHCKYGCIADHLIANGVTVQEWISVKDRLPEERDSIFAKFYGTERWTEGMFLKISKDVLACVEYEDGTKAVKALHTNDGKWHLGFKQVKVTHWMPLPQPPKGE